MSETPPPETAAEKAEARAIRRRWITIGELVAVAGVLIAAVSLWLNWADRREDTAKADAEKAAAARKAVTATLIGKAEDGGRRVVLGDPNQPALADIAVAFPRALGIPPQTSIVEPRVEADWVKGPLLKLTDGGADAVRGKLPVLITATIVEGDRPLTDRAIYDVVFATEGHTFSGRSLRLEGVVFRERVAGDATARLDSLWAAEARRLASAKKDQPTISSGLKK